MSDESSKRSAQASSPDFSRTQIRNTQGGFKDLGITPLARQLGLTHEQTNGHWCSRCRGIWFGYTLEAQCPVCGNRNG